MLTNINTCLILIFYASTLLLTTIGNCSSPCVSPATAAALFETGSKIAAESDSEDYGADEDGVVDVDDDEALADALWEASHIQGH